MNDEAFTGLEAAIVLIAFVVVAAVFSYMMLGAGFFTSQKSQEVVHTATSQTSSSVDLAGSVVVIGDEDKLANATFYLQLTSGGTAVDLNRTAYAVTTDNAFALLNSTQVKYTWYNNGTDTDSLLEAGELVKVDIPLSKSLLTGDTKAVVTVNPRQIFTIDVKPSVGAALSLARTAPTRIDKGIYYEVY
ncbi:MAG: flagellin [Methanofollis sp.]|uniref:flagellin n=1 Tax=Methanofollis sp. TaxID=2052835 RepID=UPI00261E01F3|nr:flagellin [Methanofollis sp.]MDD4256087.1 flagellin [Methanofollis sp.]